MYDNINYKRLFLIALITSPLLGIFSISPILLFGLEPRDAQLPVEIHPYRHFFGILMVSHVVFITWLINILILKYIKMKPNKPYLRHIVSFVMVFLTVSLVTYFIRPKARFNSELHILYPFIASFSHNSFINIIIDLVILQQRKQNIEIELTNMKLSNMEARQHRLLSQIQPHFLFNALNTLRLLIKPSPHEAENYVVKLSAFMRSAIDHNGQSLISLEEELKICRDYLDMQKVRFQSSFDFVIDIDEKWLTGYFLPAFTLQLLAENTIKHNSFTKEKPLKLHFFITDADLMVVENTLSPKSFKEDSTKIGLKNLFERYKLITSSKYEPQIVETEQHFRVLLPLLQV